MRPALALLLALLLAGCVVLPRESSDDHGDCQLVTRSYTLQAAEVSGGLQVRNNDEAKALVPVVLGLFAGSLVVSGSFVVVNDTAHWLEAQGRCSDSVTRQATRTLTEGAVAAGGQVLQTKDAVAAWVTREMAGSGPAASGK